MLTKELQEKIVSFVKKEPCLVQDLSRHIGKSWVATEGYVEKISRDTGLIKTKAFRKGTKGAVKVVYWNYSESAQGDELKEHLFQKLKMVSSKREFDPLEIFQYVHDRKSNAIVEYASRPLTSKKQSIFSFLRQANDELLCFSGNLSWLNLSEGGKKVPSVLEELLERGVVMKILCRIDIASLKNISIVEGLMKKYPGQIDVRHCRQSLRCVVLDSKLARFTGEESKEYFKEGELESDLKIFYEIYDSEWVDWLKKVFWYLYRNSVDYRQRLEALDRIKI